MLSQNVGVQQALVGKKKMMPKAEATKERLIKIMEKVAVLLELSGGKFFQVNCLSKRRPQYCIFDLVITTIRGILKYAGYENRLFGLKYKFEI